MYATMEPWAHRWILGQAPHGVHALYNIIA
jgi:hypothetical protein